MPLYGKYYRYIVYIWSIQGVFLNLNCDYSNYVAFDSLWPPTSTPARLAKELALRVEAGAGASVGGCWVRCWATQFNELDHAA